MSVFQTVTVITCTGERPEAFALCKRWMQAQTYPGPVQWVIVDDGRFASDVEFVKSNWSVEIIQPEMKWEPGMITQGRNMRLALEHATGDLLFCIEDDDHYSPVYLELMLDLYRSSCSIYDKQFQLFGCANARYYNVLHRKYAHMQNELHASLCETLWTREQNGLLRDACLSGEQFIDIVFWRMAREQQIPGMTVRHADASVGIKGLPGRAGIGVGHRLDPRVQWKSDMTFEVLREWIGTDAMHYGKYYNEMTVQR